MGSHPKGALRPASGVFYVHRGTEFTLGNFAEALAKPEMTESFVNSAVIATVATVFSLAVTITSGYMLSRFQGATARCTCSPSGWASWTPTGGCCCHTSPSTSAFSRGS